MPATGGEGVILAEGGKSAGFALYVQDSKLVYHYNWFERQRTNLVSEIPLPKGKSTVAVEFAYDRGGLGKGGEAAIAFFMTTNPDRSRCSTSRLATIPAIISAASCVRLRRCSAARTRGCRRGLPGSPGRFSGAYRAPIITAPDNAAALPSQRWVNVAASSCT